MPRWRPGNPSRHTVRVIALLGVRIEVKELIVLIQASGHEDVERIVDVVRQQPNSAIAFAMFELQLGALFSLFVTSYSRSLQRQYMRSCDRALPRSGLCWTVSAMIVNIGRIRGGVDHSRSPTERCARWSRRVRPDQNISFGSSLLNALKSAT